jgi:hypothetical protein
MRDGDSFSSGLLLGMGLLAFFFPPFAWSRRNAFRKPLILTFIHLFYTQIHCPHDHD